jgi:hypothetical protein
LDFRARPRNRAYLATLCLATTNNCMLECDVFRNGERNETQTRFVETPLHDEIGIMDLRHMTMKSSSKGARHMPGTVAKTSLDFASFTLA